VGHENFQSLEHLQQSGLLENDGFIGKRQSEEPSAIKQASIIETETIAINKNIKIVMFMAADPLGLQLLDKGRSVAGARLPYIQRTRMGHPLTLDMRDAYLPLP